VSHPHVPDTQAPSSDKPGPILVSSATEVLAATSQQAARTTEEATAVQETSTTVDEVKQTAQVSSLKSRVVAEAAQK
jgi:hypothetical protein